MRVRERNELVERLARRALAIISPCLYEHEWKDCFQEFAAAFREELIRHEVERERMRKRLGRPEEDTP
jgi:hypothetical protein